MATMYKYVNGVKSEMTAEEIKTWEDGQPTAEQINKYKIADAKDLRNELLVETDWMAGSDYTMTDAWKTYRQALRDLPAADGFPDVDFPTKPS